MSRFASAPWPLRTAYLALLASAGVTLLAGVAGLVALAGLRRLSAHLDLGVAPAWLWYFRADPTVRRWVGIGAIVAAGLAGLLVLAVVRGLRPPLHGAARWASGAELNRAGLFAKRGILLGRVRGRLLTFGGPEHVMLYAPTRSGKGVGVVIPNLLTWPGSLVVLDVKRENWAASAGFRAAHGQRVLLFDPLDPEGRTARFNPLGHIDRTDPVAVLDELQKLAVMLFPAPQNADPFWAEAARTGFIGVGAYIAETVEHAFSLGSIYRVLTEGDARTAMPKIIAARRAGGQPLSAGCVSALNDFCSASENTFASIKQTISARMNLWLNPRICAATDVSDFDLRDLRAQHLSLYFGVTPDNLDRVAPLYSLVLQLLIDLNTRTLPKPGAGNEVLVLLDEFARLGQATVIAQAFSYVAGYGLRLLPVLQSPAQLRREYGPDLAEEIMANCGVEIAFAPKDLKVARELSERLGTWTYAGRATSRPTLLSQGRRSLTESDQRRALMMPQELMQMSERRMLVLKAGLPPVRANKIVYWREGAFRRRVMDPPTLASRASASSLAEGSSTLVSALGSDDSDLRLDLDLDLGLPAVPPQGASVAEVEAWADRFVDASVVRTEKQHGG